MRLLAASLLVASALLLAAASPAGAVEWSGDVTAASDYVFRGVSQTQEGPALQAGVSASWDPGWYVAGWASNVDFGAGDGADVEVDALAGWAGDAGESWSIDAAVVRYVYPGEQRWDYTELLVTAEHRERLLLSAAWSNDALALGRPGSYAGVGWRFTLRRQWRLELFAAWQAASALTHGGYAHGEIRALRAWKSIELAIVGHVIEASARDDFGDTADPRLTVSVTKTFER